MTLVLSVAIFVACVNWSSATVIQDGPLASGRIIGGQTAYPAQFPFAAAINIQTSNSRLFCVGALLNHLWVVTGAHCVVGAVLFTIALGANSLSLVDPNRITLATSTYEIHPDYNPDTMEHDVGLIRFRLGIEYTDYIRPVDFLPTSEILDYQNVLAVGWGQLSDSETALSDELRWVLMTAIPNIECRLTYGNQIRDTMVCASGNFNEGPCLGDSGGPMVHLQNGSRMTVVAVSSFLSGNGCESSDPSGYTRLFPYIDWIRNTTDIWT